MATRLGVVINLESKYKPNIVNFENYYCLNPDYPDFRICRIAKFPSVEGQVCHLLSATLGLALAFTFSCSSDDGGWSNTNHTYYYSMFGINKNSLNSCSTIEALFTSKSPNTDKRSFKDVKDRWDEVERLDGSFIESGTGWTESYIKNILVESDVPPKEADSYIALLKSRGKNE
ncbi:hypothetical protein R83H12_02365 [Fibrobacteria bacterium R8-3-H12]